MSLVNEALKRAKEAQAKAPAPEGTIPHLRPVESAPTEWRGTGLVLPIILTLVALGGLFFLWQAAPRNITAKATSAAALPGTITNPLEGRVRSPLRAAATAEPGNAAAVSTTQRRAEDSAPHPATAMPASPGASNTAAPFATASPTNASAPGVVAAQAAAALPAASASSVSTNLPSPPAPPVAAPPPPRLQAIVFNPSRPSAMISGKTVFVGDRVAGLQVSAITRDSATLVGPGGTIHLSLEP